MSEVNNVKVEYYFHRVGIVYNKMKIKHISDNSRLLLKYLISTNTSLSIFYDIQKLKIHRP